MSKWLIAIVAVLLVAVLVVVLVLSCDGTTPDEPTKEPEPTESAPEPTEPSEGPLKVGMVSDVGGVDDASFNQNTWDGLVRAQEELGVEVQFIESQAQADYEKNITEFAEQEYDLIFTVGFLLNDATAKMAPLYPDAHFAGIDQWYDPPIDNAAAITFAVDEAAFPIGYLAAGWAALQDPDDPQVGWIGGMEIPPVQQFIVAYEAGVAYYNDAKGTNVQAKGVYVGDFEAPDEGKIQGNSLIDEGVDVIFGVGGKTGNGGLAAAKERGKWGVGVDVDQYFTLPNEKDILITSCMKRLDNAVFAVTEAELNGEFPGGALYVGTLENGGVGLAPYHDYEDQIPAELTAEVTAIQADIAAGRLCTGWGECDIEDVPTVDIKVGMVSDVGGIDDASFNQNTWEGLERAQAELGVQAQFIESQAQADYERNITEFAEQGYDLIFTVGFLLNDATAKMAPLYPDAHFAGIDQWYDPPIDNAAALTFAVDQAAFPIGYLAAGWAALQDPDDPQVGWIGGMEIPPVQQFIVAYEAGVAYYNKQKGADVQAKGVYVGDFEAPDEGKIQGNSLIDEGVDVIFGVGGKTGNGGLAAAKERGKWGVGVDVDQYFTLPNEKDILITSCMKRLDNAVFTVTEAEVNDEFPGGALYVGTLENGGVGLAPYHDFEGQIPAELTAEVTAIQAAIVAGELCTGWGECDIEDVPTVDIKVGMVSDVGGIDDASFNQNTWEGLERAQAELGVQAQFIESQAQADYERNITEFAEQDYDLIFTVGFLLNDATAKMAPLYPDAHFAGIDQWYDPPIDNAAALTFAVDQAAFPIGYLAAGWAVLQDPDDPQVGWIGGMEIPPVQQFIVAYEAGVAYYNDAKGTDVQVKGVYVGDFEAPDEGKIQGNSLIDEGVDVIFGVGGKTGNGGLAAAKERGKWGVGVDVDQYFTLPNEKDILITSCMKRLDNAVFTVTEAEVNDEFPGGALYVGTLENGGVGLAPYHDFEEEIPAELTAEVEAILAGIIDGSISTGWPLE